MYICIYIYELNYNVVWKHTYQFGNWTDFISLSKRVGIHRRTSAPPSSSLRKQSGCESQVQCHVTQSDSPSVWRRTSLVSAIFCDSLIFTRPQIFGMQVGLGPPACHWLAMHLTFCQAWGKRHWGRRVGGSDGLSWPTCGTRTGGADFQSTLCW